MPDGQERLLAQAQAGDESARTVLVRTHQRAVFRLLDRMLRPAGLAELVEDLAQETFLRAFAALERFEPGGAASFSTWLLTIASRRAVNELQRKRRPTESLERCAEVLVAHARADESQRRRRLAELIAGAVGRLSPPYRAAFLLAEYHGFTDGQIAEALDLEPGTVRSRLSKARAQIRAALEEIRHER